VQLKRCQDELKTAQEQNKAVETLQKNYDDRQSKESKEVCHHK